MQPGEAGLDLAPVADPDGAEDVPLEELLALDPLAVHPLGRVGRHGLALEAEHDLGGRLRPERVRVHHVVVDSHDVAAQEALLVRSAEEVDGAEREQALVLGPRVPGRDPEIPRGRAAAVARLHGDVAPEEVRAESLPCARRAVVG